MPQSSPRALFAILFDQVGTVDQIGIEERVAKYTPAASRKHRSSGGSKPLPRWSTSPRSRAKTLPARWRPFAESPASHDGTDVPQVAAVCVLSAMVRHAKKHVADSPVKIASVATAFPSGQAPLKTRLAEVKAAVADGADEIDMVIKSRCVPRGRIWRGAGRDCRGRGSLW